jgi:hypothetical protein
VGLRHRGKVDEIDWRLDGFDAVDSVVGVITNNSSLMPLLVLSPTTPVFLVLSPTTRVWNVAFHTPSGVITGNNLCAGSGYTLCAPLFPDASVFKKLQVYETVNW